MEDPRLSLSPSPPGATNRPGIPGNPGRSRARWLFWTTAALVILTLAAVNVSWRIQEARREERENPWPAVYRLLEGAHSIDVMALDPNGEQEGGERFHHYSVLGRATIRDAGEIKALADAYRKGREDWVDMYLCFDPRHGIHLRHSGRELDLVICFQCHQAYLFLDYYEGRLHSISGTPRSTFDRIFEEAGLRIAK